MSFWADKIAQQGPGLPQPGVVTYARSAPGRWWQAGTEHEQPVQLPGGARPEPQVPVRDYAPQEAQSIGHVDRCPRCGSRDYAEFAPDLSMGGRAMPGIHSIKQCFECRYPGVDASGDVIKTRGGGAVNAETVATMKVRQQGNPRVGSWGGAHTFDNAPNIDHLVR